jgi:hypothetical protein
MQTPRPLRGADGVPRPKERATARDTAQYLLRYRSPSNVHPGFAFPCDAEGNVALDELSDRALKNYLYARVVTGSELGWPSIERRR